MILTKTLRAITVALCLSVALPSGVAQANAYREKGKSVVVAKSNITVTPPRDWNRLDIAPGKNTEVWTLDGEQLNDITFYGGIEAGKPLMREKSKKREPLPKFTRETLLVEIPELLEGTYRASKNIGSFSVIGSAPGRFLDNDGIIFTYEYVDVDNLPRKGEARATVVNGRLYMATFDAPRLHYFDRNVADFRALIDTAKLI